MGQTLAPTMATCEEELASGFWGASREVTMDSSSPLEEPAGAMAMDFLYFSAEASRFVILTQKRIFMRWVCIDWRNSCGIGNYIVLMVQNQNFPNLSFPHPIYFFLFNTFEREKNRTEKFSKRYTKYKYLPIFSPLLSHFEGGTAEWQKQSWNFFKKQKFSVHIHHLWIVCPLVLNEVEKWLRKNWVFSIYK